MTMPISSIAMLSGVRQLTTPCASWTRMSIMTSPQALNCKEDIGGAVERRHAAWQRYIGDAQEQDAAEDGHHRGRAPDGAMITIAAHIHDGSQEKERANDEAEQRHQHGGDRHQHDAADQKPRIDGLLFLGVGLAVEGLEKSGRVPIPDDKAP